MSSQYASWALSGYGKQLLREILLAHRGGAEPQRWTRLIDGLIADPWPGYLPLQLGDSIYLDQVLSHPLSSGASTRHHLTVAHWKRGLASKPVAGNDRLDCEENSLVQQYLESYGAVEGDEFDLMVDALRDIADQHFPHFAFAMKGLTELEARDQIPLGFSKTHQAALESLLRQSLEAIHYFPNFTISK